MKSHEYGQSETEDSTADERFNLYQVENEDTIKDEYSFSDLLLPWEDIRKEIMRRLKRNINKGVII